MKESIVVTGLPSQMVIDLYFNYWREYIFPIEEEKRKAAFGCLLIDVAARLYGVEVMATLGFRLINYSMDHRLQSDLEFNPAEDKPNKGK